MSGSPWSVVARSTVEAGDIVVGLVARKAGRNIAPGAFELGTPPCFFWDLSVICCYEAEPPTSVGRGLTAVSILASLACTLP